MEKQIIKLKLEVAELKTIEQSKAKQIKETFEPMVEMLEGFEKAYNQIVSEGQNGITEELTAKARRLRIDIGKVRIQTGKLKDEGKAEYLRAERAIQAVHNIIVWAVTDKENKLKEIEEHFEILEKERLEKLQLERAEQIAPYVDDMFDRDLASMEEDVWGAYFSTKKKDYEDRIEAEKKAEEERRENERLDKIEQHRRLETAPYSQFFTKDPDLRNISENDYKAWLDELKKSKADYDAEQERIRKENERIKKEQEAERIKVEADRKARDEKQRKEREAYEAKLRKEREERGRIEAEIKAKADAEEAEKKRIAEEQRKADLAPDKEKLLKFANTLTSIELPALKSKEARDIIGYAHSAIADIAKKIINATNEKL